MKDYMQIMDEIEKLLGLIIKGVRAADDPFDGRTWASKGQRQFKPCDCTPLDPRCDCGKYDNAEVFSKYLIKTYPNETEEVLIVGEDIVSMPPYPYMCSETKYSVIRTKHREYLIPDESGQIGKKMRDRNTKGGKWSSVLLRGKIRYRHLATVQFDFVDTETFDSLCKIKGESNDPFDVRPW